MKTFNTRKSADITSTPERSVSSRIQAHGKKGKFADGNHFDALYNEDDEEDTEKKATITEEKKGVYPLFVQTHGKVQQESNNKKKQQQEETDSLLTATTEDVEGGRELSTASVKEEGGRIRNKLTTTGGKTKK